MYDKQYSSVRLVYWVMQVQNLKLWLPLELWWSRHNLTWRWLTVGGSCAPNSGQQIDDVHLPQFRQMDSPKDKSASGWALDLHCSYIICYKNRRTKGDTNFYMKNSGGKNHKRQTTMITIENLATNVENNNGISPFLCSLQEIYIGDKR